jgi:IS605 OrfB family transposase
VKVGRNCTVELVVDEETEKRLRRLCDLSSKLWNEINYARLKMWLEKKGIDFEGTYREFYERYKPLIGSATAQTIIKKNNDAWMAFFRLLELRREGRLPPFMKKVRPPGYKKKRKSRTLWTAIRKDQYKVDGDRIVLQGLGAVGRVEVRCKGPIYLRGERGGIEIRYDADRGKWYAHIAFSKVSEKMVKGEWRPVPRQPKGNLTAGIDIGINNLMAIYVENGLTRLVNGKPLKSISYYWRKKISEYQSTLNKYGLETSKKLRRMYAKWKRQIRGYIDAKVIAVDVNENAIVYGNDDFIERFETNEGIIRTRYFLKRRRIQSRIRGKWLRARLLEKYRSREWRRIKEIYHKAVKRIIDKAKEADVKIIIMEDLKHLNRKNTGSKELNGRLHRWSYSRFQKILEYQAKLCGLHVKYINPRGTSKTCPICGDELEESSNGRRLRKCKRCGLEEDRDVIAVKNLVKRYYEERMDAKTP